MPGPAETHPVPQAGPRATTPPAGKRGRGSAPSRRALPAVSLVAACALMGLPNLGQRLFWQDEAETAVIARDIRRFGVPRVYDGRNLVTTDGGKDFNGRYLLTSKPWLPYYLAAGAQALWGEANWSSRLPFVLCAGGAVVWLGLALWDASPGGLALPAGFYLVSSVPFWLMARQARYYGLVVLLTVAGMALYVRWLGGRRRGWRPAAWAAPLILLAYTHYLSVMYVAAGIGAHLLVTRAYRGRWGALCTTILVGAASVLPWLFYSRAGAWFRMPAVAARPALVAPLFPLLTNVVQPLLLPLLVICWLAALFAWPELRGRWREPWVQLAVITLGTTLLLHCVLSCFHIVPPFTRYLIALFPCYALVFGAAASALASRHKLLTLGAIIVVQFTTAPAALAGWVLGPDQSYSLLQAGALRCPQQQFYGELTHPYRGPLDCVVAELRARARPTDTVFIEFETEPIVWYTRLRVLRCLPFASPPNWIIIRPGAGLGLPSVLWHGIERGPARVQDSAWWKLRPDLLRNFVRDNHVYLLDYVRRHAYWPIATACPDAQIQDYPEFPVHPFASPTSAYGGRRVTLYHYSGPQGEIAGAGARLRAGCP